MQGMLNPLIMILALAGVIVCWRGARRGGGIQRSGLWFFGLLVVGGAVSLIGQLLVVPRLMAGAGTIPLRDLGWQMALVALPGTLLQVSAFVILLAGFYRDGGRPQV